MIETHPLEVFMPKGARYFLLGSFIPNVSKEPKYDWFYGSRRNYFWPILREVYGLKLETIKEKQKLFTKLGMAITDIIYQCERVGGSSLDANLKNIVYNSEAIEKIFRERKIATIFFSSRFVETKFRKMFKEIIKKNPNLKMVTLPSPSPRYAAIKVEEKIKIYKSVLPKIHG